jgi:hypothetical protein
MTENLIFEAYFDNFPDRKPVWRWRGIVAGGDEEGQILIVSWHGYGSMDEAVLGCLGFLNYVQSHHWTHDGEGKVLRARA